MNPVYIWDGRSLPNSDQPGSDVTLNLLGGTSPAAAAAAVLAAAAAATIAVRNVLWRRLRKPGSMMFAVLASVSDLFVGVRVAGRRGNSRKARDDARRRRGRGSKWVAVWRAQSIRMYRLLRIID